METRKTLLSMGVFFGMAVGIYYAVSPYEQCVRSQTAQLRAEYGNVNFDAPGGLGKRPTFTVKVAGKAEMTTPRKALALWAARSFFADERSVTVTDNAQRKAIAHYIYGREQ